MTLLSNLLLFSPGYSGFSSYVRRVMPALPGMRLLIDGARGPVCRSGHTLPEESPSGALALLARLSLTQHGVDVGKALAVAGLKPSEIQAVYSPFCDALFALPEVPQVITCHDLTPLHFPNSRRAAWRYRFWNPGHLRLARRVIAISRFVADQLIEIGLSGDQISVVPNGIGIVGRARSEPGGKDLLMLARHDGNKNVVHAVRGFGRFLARRPNWSGRLWVVGRRGRRTPELQRAIRDLGLTERVKLLDAVDRAQLDHLIDRSLALISSSWMEGFNYPVLEAMAEGIPCLISDIPVHRELYHDVALFFDPYDAGEELAARMEELMSDHTLWSQLSLLGIGRANELSLKHQQQAILDVIGELKPKIY